MGHERRDVDDEVAVDPQGTITVKTWSPETLRRHIKRWPLLETDSERLRAIRDLDDELAESVGETENIAVDGLLGFIAEGLDPTSSATAEASHLAVGTATTAPAGTDTALGNEVHRTFVGDADVDGQDLLTSTFLSQTEANGHLITEIALYGGPVGSGKPMLTKALLGAGNEIDKNSELLATIDYTVEIRRPA